MVRIYCFLQFSVVSFTCFPIKLLFSGLSPDQWYHSPMTDFCPAADTTGSRSSVKSHAAKRMVRKCYKVRNLHCFSLTILSILLLWCCHGCWCIAWSAVEVGRFLGLVCFRYNLFSTSGMVWEEVEVPRVTPWGYGLWDLNCKKYT